MAYAYGGDKYKDLWIASQTYFSNKLIDMLPRSNPLLMKIAGNNNVKGKELKGKRFVEPILARTVNSVSGIGYRDQIHVDYAANLLEVVEVEPKLIYQGVTVNDKELAVNNANELVDLLSINQRAVREGFARFFAKTIYESGNPAEGTPSYMLNGLAYMISENPYKNGLYVYNLLRGGDPGVGNEFWRNRAGEWLKKSSDSSAPDPASPWPTDKAEQAKKLIDAMTMMLLVLNGVSEVAALDKMEPVVDGIYMNYFFYNLFQYARYQILHINNLAEQKIDMGFVKLEHMGVPVYLDKNCPINKIYFVDSSQIDLLYIPGENFKQDVKILPNYFAKQYITSFMGNFIIHKARNCGVISLNNQTKQTVQGVEVWQGNGLPNQCNVCLSNTYVDYDYVQPSTAGYADDREHSGYSGSGEYADNYTPPAHTGVRYTKDNVKDINPDKKSPNSKK
jgi:hypothetical protein